MGGAEVIDSQTPWRPSHAASGSLTRLAAGRSADVYAWGDDYVLKLFQPGFPLAYIALELKNARSARALGIPTPSDAGHVEWRERSGIVFERVDGPTVYELLQTGAQTTAQLGRTFFDIQQSIHRCNFSELMPIQAKLAGRIRLAKRLPQTLRGEAIDALQRAPLSDTVCHGDFHPMNVIMAASGPVVIDWMDMSRGNPAIDVMQTLLYLRFGRGREINQATRYEFLDAYLERCREVWSGRMEQLQHWQRPLAVARMSISSVNDDERSDLMGLIEDRHSCIL
jgi:aminoglycoside phosphotransferase (APT) family kinase protein